MNYKIRAWLSFSEDILANETGQRADGAPVRKLAVVCVLENPYAGRFSEDLSLLVKESAQLGKEFGRRLTALAGAERLQGGGKAWISSSGKRGGPGTTIDVPLAHKDALYVRSHYDTMTITLHDAPMPRELAV